MACCASSCSRFSRARCSASPTRRGWPGAAALAAAILLGRRQALGWIFGAAVCVVYLVVGVAHAVMVNVSDGVLSTGVWCVFGADVAVPALVLAGLFTVRPWFLAHARRGRSVGAARGASARTAVLERERRRGWGRRVRGGAPGRGTRGGPRGRATR